MIALSRARPVSINIFAAAFFLAALMSFLDALFRLPVAQLSLQRSLPAVVWSRDAVIIWHSAWLSIALIPISMVWLSAVRFARWLVTFMAVAKLVLLAVTLAENPALIALLTPLSLGSLVLSLLAVAVLFTSASNRWFKDKGGADPAVFE